MEKLSSATSMAERTFGTIRYVLLNDLNLFMV